MFSFKRNINALRALADDAKEYTRLQGEALRLDLLTRFTIALSGILVGAILLVVFAIALVFLSECVVFALAPHVGGMVWACAIVAVFYCIVALVVYLRRKKWITDPIANFLGHTFLDDDEDDPADESGTAVVEAADL